MMRSLFLLPLLAVLARGQDAFIYPPPANTFEGDSSEYPQFTVGETIQLRWSSSLKTISIGLRHTSDKIILIDGRAQGSILDKKTNRNTTSWVVQGNSLYTDPTYYFAGLSDDNTSYFTSNYFIIKQASTPSSSSTTASASSSSSTSTAPASTSSQAVNGTAAPQTSQTSDPAQQKDKGATSGLSTGAKVGLGVAIPLGVIAIAAAAFFLYRRGVRQGQLEAAAPKPFSQDVSQQPSPAALPAHDGGKLVFADHTNGGGGGWIHEMPSERKPAQLP